MLRISTKFAINAGRATRALDRQAESVLTRWGAYTMTTARQSLRSAGKSNESSPPGKPPRVHSRTQFLKRLIRFFYIREERAVIVGPTVAPGRTGDVTHALEHGGLRRFLVRLRTGRRGPDGKPERETKVIAGRIEARPFMRPAMEKNLPHLTRWRQMTGH